jgi:microcystin-dependent protein
MPLDFPNSPTNGQIFTSGIKKWQWSTAEGSWLASNYAPSSGGVPVGYVGYYAATSAPTGWAECNGAAVTVALGSTYTDIRNFLIAQGNPFGVSGSDPLLPDLRGIFVKSSGTQTYNSISYSGIFGSKENDNVGNHSHNFTYNTKNYTRAESGIGLGCCLWVGNLSTTDATSGNSLINETRPANLALLACIKL